MPRFLLRAALCLALVSLCVPGSAREAPEKPTKDLSKAPAGLYQLRVSHTQVDFWIMHLGLSRYYGRIDKATGDLMFDPANPEKSTLTAQVLMADVNTPFKNPTTGSKGLDMMICAPMAFDCAKYPTSTFQSTKVVRTGDNTGDIEGQLTLHGITKPLVLHAVWNGGMKSAGGGDSYDLGFDVTGIIKRSDYGLTSMDWTTVVADEINLMIQGEFRHNN